MQLLRVVRDFRPLIVTPAGLIGSSRNRIVLYSSSGEQIPLFALPDSFGNQLLDRNKLLFRMRRSGVNQACLFQGGYYLSYRGLIRRYDSSSHKLTGQYSIPRGRGVLSLTALERLPGFRDGVFFGDYYSNRGKGGVAIHRISESGGLEVVYRFGPGRVNHIHNVLPDRYRNCVWILTGDDDAAAAIYMATGDFSRVRPVVRGRQIHRACVAFPTEAGLLYATDTPFEANWLSLLEEGEDGWRVKRLFPLNGPSIYGCATKDYYVFSTSTEPDPRTGKSRRALLDNKPAGGIRENRSDIVLCRKDNLEARVAVSRAKDPWPYRLFQFGAITFPSGDNPTDILYSHNIGSKLNDLSMEVWKTT